MNKGIYVTFYSGYSNEIVGGEAGSFLPGCPCC